MKQFFRSLFLSLLCSVALTFLLNFVVRPLFKKLRRAIYLRRHPKEAEYLRRLSDPDFRDAIREVNREFPKIKGLSKPKVRMPVLILPFILLMSMTGFWNPFAHMHAQWFSGANHYIVAGGTGAQDGTAWDSAWSDLPAGTNSHVRGDTYWVASGTYGSGPYNFRDDLSGSTYIYIKKATQSAHGSETGWQTSYGVGQAIWSSSANLWMVWQSYYDIDGAGASGVQGIKLICTASDSGGNGSLNIPSTFSPGYLNIKSVEMQMTGPGSGDGAVICASSGGPGNYYFYNCYIHDTSAFWMQFAGDTAGPILIEHCYFKTCGSANPTYHSAGIIICSNSGSGFTIRYNRLENMTNAPSANTCWIEPQGTAGTGWYVYGNIFVATDPNESTGQGIFSYTSSDYGSNIRIYNNTIYGLHGSGGGAFGVYLTAGCSDSIVRNNIWQACDSAPVFTNVATQDHNILNTGEVNFKNAAAGDFHLAADTSAWYTLGFPYNVDPDGVMRISSIGAYQAGGGGSLIMVRK